MGAGAAGADAGRWRCRCSGYGALSENDLLSFMVVKGAKEAGGFGMKMARDLTVTTITDQGGPAAVAGMVPGVRIVEVNGKAVSTTEEAVEATRPTPIGAKVHFRCVPPPTKPEQGHFRPSELWGWLDQQIERWMPEGMPFVEYRQGLGDVLDAGTGYESFRWMKSHDHNSLTALTMDPTLVAALGYDGKEVDGEIVGGLRVGNLAEMDTRTLGNGGFDVILADYLLSAANALPPYDPGLLLNKLVGMLRPGGLLLVVGQEPEDTMCGDGESAKLFAELMRTRNTVPAVLGGMRPYRELPLQWVHGQLDNIECADQSDCFEIRAVQAFRVGYELSGVAMGTVKALAAWPGLQSQMEKHYVEKLAKLQDVEGERGLALECDVYYAVVLQRSGSAGVDRVNGDSDWERAGADYGTQWADL